MKKMIKNGNSIIIVLDNGTMLQNDSCTKELYEQIQKCASDDEIAALLLPGLQEVLEKRAAAQGIMERVKKSDILSLEGSSIYWTCVSEMSLPQNFAEKILDAEESNNEDALESYKNFWTLLCLNPDERVRQNLFWFLNTWGMRISKTGLFVGYRNVDISEEGNINMFSQELCDAVLYAYNTVHGQKKSLSDYWLVFNGENYDLLTSTQLLFAERTNQEDYVKYNLKETYNELKAVNFKPSNIGDDTVFTDHYTHKMQIKIGEMVTIPRKDCDCDSAVECSRGLHLGGTGWIEQSYFGECGIACLCNPRDVVAIPKDANYGKLRTCAYLPIARVEYDNYGHVIPLNVDDGFDSKWVKTVLYDGVMCEEDSPMYRIEIPNIPEINKSLVTQDILEIARKYMK